MNVANWNAFDWALVAIVALSMVRAYITGLVRAIAGLSWYYCGGHYDCQLGLCQPGGQLRRERGWIVSQEMARAVAFLVKMTTAVRTEEWIAATAWSPSIPGILMSKMTRSGCRLRTSSTASSPRPVEPTTSKPSSTRISHRSSRTTASSSAITTVLATCHPVPVLPLLGGIDQHPTASTRSQSSRPDVRRGGRRSAHPGHARARRSIGATSRVCAIWSAWRCASVKTCVARGVSATIARTFASSACSTSASSCASITSSSARARSRRADTSNSRRSAALAAIGETRPHGGQSTTTRRPGTFAVAASTTAASSATPRPGDAGTAEPAVDELVRRGDVGTEVAVGGAEIARQVESVKGADRDRGGPGEARLEHPPDRQVHPRRDAGVVDSYRGGDPPETGGFHDDTRTSPRPQRRLQTAASESIASSRTTGVAHSATRRAEPARSRRSSGCSIAARPSASIARSAAR